MQYDFFPLKIQIIISKIPQNTDPLALLRWRNENEETPICRSKNIKKKQQ